MLISSKEIMWPGIFSTSDLILELGKSFKLRKDGCSNPPRLSLRVSSLIEQKGNSLCIQCEHSHEPFGEISLFEHFAWTNPLQLLHDVCRRCKGMKRLQIRHLLFLLRMAFINGRRGIKTEGKQNLYRYNNRN